MTRHVVSEQSRTLTFEKEYSGSTANVLRSVLLKKADAGVMLHSELDKEPAEVKGQIRTLLKTPDIPSHPLSAHPRVAKAVQETVKKAVLSLGATPSGDELLRQIWLALPVAADYARDYRSLENVDAKKLSN